MNEPLHFKTRDEFRCWLRDNCTSNEGVWLLFGKTRELVTVKAGEALEEALCFGWIEIFGDMDRNATRIEMVDKIGDTASFASPFPSFKEHDHSRACLFSFLLKHHQAIDERIVVGLVFFFGKLWLVGYDRLEHCHW